MPKLNRTMFCVLAGLGLVAFFSALAPSPAQAELFYCKSTRTPEGNRAYCNFLLFDKSFTRHQQVIVGQGAIREVPVNGRYDVFCVLVQDTQRTPDQFAYRKQQCQKSDTGRNYQFPIRALNMRRGRNGFSTDAPQGFLPAQRW